MGRWNDPRNDRWRAPDDQKYLGMSAARFNLTVVGIGFMAVAAFLYFGGVGVVQDFFTDDSSSRQVEDVQTVTSTATAAAPTPTRAPTTPATAADAGGSGAAAALLNTFDTFDPFSLLGAVGSEPLTTDPAPPQVADGSLGSALLEEGDLPPGFLLFGEFSFHIPTEFGTGVTANMFASGDLVSGDFGAMVMSSVLEAPSDAAGGLGDLGGLDEMSQAELDEIAAAFEQLGIGFSDFRMLDASGLGDGGIGMHLVMDLSGLSETFGALDEEPLPFDAIAWDMYMFGRGERMLMVMVIWPADGAPGVDGRALAETMDAKAAAP